MTVKIIETIRYFSFLSVIDKTLHFHLLEEERERERMLSSTADEKRQILSVDRQQVGLFYYSFFADFLFNLTIISSSSRSVLDEEFRWSSFRFFSFSSISR